MSVEIDSKGVEYIRIPLGKSKDLSNKKYGKLLCLFRVKKIKKNKI